MPLWWCLRLVVPNDLTSGSQHHPVALHRGRGAGMLERDLTVPSAAGRHRVLWPAGAASGPRYGRG